MSIRLRLTLLYSAILALTLIVFSVALYVVVSRVTLNVFAEALIEEAHRMVREAQFQLGHIGFPGRRVAAPDTYIQTVRADGEVLDRSSNLGSFVIPVGDASQEAIENGRPTTGIASTENGRLLVYNLPVASQGRIVGIVQVARSLVDYDQALNTLRRILMIVGGIATVAAFGVGWVLAGAGLRPIHRITRTAQAIGAERDFDQRVDYDGPADEVGQLATTFNHMLAELQDAYRQVEQALKAQRRFVADASHELRTPLTTIRGNLELLRREPPIDEEEGEAVLADVVDESERLIRLVSDLLVLARADAGRALRSERVAIMPLVEDVRRQAETLDPDVEIRCDDLPALAVVADPDALKQVLLILVDNALKYTTAEGTITIEAAAHDGQVAISVRDTGPGIEPEVLPHIFERFYRGDSARAGAGFGLGLAIAKTLVEAQAGTIEVESEVGEGSAFTVRLPQASRS